MEIENIQKYVRIQVRYSGKTGKPVGIWCMSSCCKK